MKTKNATLQGVAAMAILALFMLSATAHAATSTTQSTTTATDTDTVTQETQDQCTTTSTTTTVSSTTTSTSTGTAETQQTGDQATSAQNQTGEDEPCGTNNQVTTDEGLVGPNEVQGDNVNVHEADQGDQNQIKGAQADQTIAGEVQVNDNGVSESAAPSFSLAPSIGANGQLGVTISGENIVGPRSFLITLSNSMDPTTHTLAVTLDGNRVSQASTVDEVLHHSSTAPAYVVVKSGSNYQLLVSVPHFSTHFLSITPLAPSPSQGFFSISALELAGAGVIITALFAAIYATRKRIYTVLV